MDNLEKILPDADNSKEAIAEMRELAEVLNALGVDEDHAWLSPSLTRGLDYYTGPVFETIIPKAPKFGSVMGGGRYNGLVGRFLDRDIPSTGMSVGLDRLMAALTKLKAVTPVKSTVQALIVGLGIPSTEALNLAAELRKAGINTEAYFSKKMKMKDQLAHADRLEIPIAIIVGEDELANGEVAIKDLITGKKLKEDIKERDAYRAAGKNTQVTVARSEMVATVREMLDNH